MDSRDKVLLPVDKILGLIESAIAKRTPFSLVRIGDGENLCMAQEAVLSQQAIMREAWARASATTRQKGVRLPDLKLRDTLLNAVRAADLVGIHPWDDRIILTESRLKRPLAERIFAHYKIKPRRLCNASITRIFPQNRRFWTALKPARVLLVSRWAARLRPIVTAAPYHLTVAGCVPFDFYNDVPKVLKAAASMRGRFDVALVSCGVSALVLAVKLARQTGCVALDFGKASQFMVEGKAGLNAPPSRFAPRSL